jgi:PAS domain S-box-containing protein
LPDKRTHFSEETAEGLFPALIEGVRKLSVDQILESAPDAMLLVGPGGKILQINSLTEGLFGYTREELIGQSVELLVPPDARALHVQHRGGYYEHPHKRMMETGLELYGLRKDGSQFPIEVSLSPLETDAGTFVLGAVRDRTKKQKVEAEIRALNAELQKKLRELEAANREMEEFTYSTAHDLRAPVRHMHTFANLLMQSTGEALKAEERNNLQKIILSAKRLGLMIDHLLEFSRLGREPLKMRPVDLNRLAQEIQSGYEDALEERGVTWKISNLPKVQADSAMLRIALTNLVDNALKFTRGRRSAVIEVGSYSDGEATTLYVKDNGVGFEMEYAGKLFQVFQRLHHQYEFEGTGIGLAAVRRIAERHGGKTWAEGRPEEGATFYISIPGGAGHDK